MTRSFEREWLLIFFMQNKIGFTSVAKKGSTNHRKRKKEKKINSWCEITVPIHTRQEDKMKRHSHKRGN